MSAINWNDIKNKALNATGVAWLVEKIQEKQDAVSHIVVSEAPTGGVEPVGDIPVGSGGGTPTIYCEIMHPIDGDVRDVLVVKGADSFLTSDYVPVLLRKSNKRNGYGWHHYKTTYYDDGGDETFVSIDDVEVKLNGSGGTAIVSGVLLCDDFDIMGYMPQIKRNNNKYWVSHGKRSIRLTKGYYSNSITHVNYRAKWGLAFIQASDFPQEHERLDVSKLVTNIAQFYVYYRWSHYGGVWSIDQVLIV